jgi:hypothetical protein
MMYVGGKLEDQCTLVRIITITHYLPVKVIGQYNLLDICVGVCIGIGMVISLSVVSYFCTTPMMRQRTLATFASMLLVVI